MSKTIFSMIIDGEIPCHKIYEDDHVIALLDIGPLSNGHTLVIPKEAKEQMHDMSEKAAAALGKILPRICFAIKRATECKGYNIIQNNGKIAHQEVKHVHFHIIPKYEEGQDFELNWNATELDHEKAVDLAKKIAAEV